MSNQTFLEGVGIVVLAVAMVVVGHLISEPTLAQWGAIVFGAGAGYLGHGARAGS